MLKTGTQLLAHSLPIHSTSCHLLDDCDHRNASLLSVNFPFPVCSTHSWGHYLDLAIRNNGNISEILTPNTPLFHHSFLTLSLRNYMLVFFFNLREISKSPTPRPIICSLPHLMALLVQPNFHTPALSSHLRSHSPSLTKVLPTTDLTHSLLHVYTWASENPWIKPHSWNKCLPSKLKISHYNWHPTLTANCYYSELVCFPISQGHYFIVSLLSSNLSSCPFLHHHAQLMVSVHSVIKNNKQNQIKFHCFSHPQPSKPVLLQASPSSSPPCSVEPVSFILQKTSPHKGHCFSFVVCDALAISPSLLEC